MVHVRDRYFDFIRGIAIIFVIGIHAFFGKYQANGYIYIAIRQFIGVAVPIFITLSGYFITLKISTTDNFSFIINQIKKLYIPILVWSIPSVLISLLRHEYSLFVTILMYFLGGLSIYYFVTLIIQFYILSPLISKAYTFHRKLLLFLSFVLSMSFVYMETYTYPSFKAMPLILSQGLSPLYLIYFVLGMYAYRENLHLDFKFILFVTILSFIWSIAETVFLIDKQYPAPAGIKPSEHIFSICICILIFSPKVRNLFKVNFLTTKIAYIGKVSLSLYLIHCYVVIVFAHIRIISQNWALSWIGITVSSLLCLQIFNRLVPNKYSKYLGLIK